MPDGRSALKVYYVSIVGRPEPERYEWGRAPLSIAECEAKLLAAAPEGVGFATLFPHIGKIFRFAPSGETVLHVRCFRPNDLAPLDLSREDGYVEFACYAEALLGADEYRFWAEARTVAAYLEKLSEVTEAPVVSHTKMGEWYR
jgi:hypothetical protein